MVTKMVNDKLLSEIEAYCKLNELEVPETLNKALRQGFTILQYGMPPNSGRVEEKVVEVVKEVIKEVPVEKVIEKVVEVPVEKIVEIIKEVPVDKIVEVEKSININVDGHEVNYLDYIGELNTKISELEIELNKTKTKLADTDIGLNESNKKVISAEAQIEKLRQELKKCKEDKGGYDLYGER